MSKEEVLAANAAFYRAFTERDALGMDALWAVDAPVVCVHPNWDILIGRDQVMSSWVAILSNPGSPRVLHSDDQAWVSGAQAMVVCKEEVGGATLIATNVFVHEDGAWKIVHHHASPVLQSVEFVAPEPSSGLPN